MVIPVATENSTAVSSTVQIFSKQIMFVGLHDPHRDKFADRQIRAVLDINDPIDLRRIGAGAGDGRSFFVDGIHQNGQGTADLTPQPAGADRCLQLHQPGLPFLFDLLRYRVRQLVGRGTSTGE